MAISVEFHKRFKELADEIEKNAKADKAEEIGISRVTFTNAYNYGILPKTPSLIRIADYFNISVDYLIGITDDDRFEKSYRPVNFIDRLNELKEEKSIKSNYELAKLVHIHRNNISQWYKLGCLPLIDDLTIIADSFDVSIDYILGRTDVKSPHRT